MNWDWMTDPVVSIFLSIVVTIVGYLLQPRVRIVWSITHGFIHLLKGSEIAARQAPPPSGKTPKPNDMPLWAQTLMVMNKGRATADSVEIALKWKPLGLTVWPPRQYVESFNPDGKFIMMFPNLSAQETISLHMIDAKELPIVFNVRCATTTGKWVDSQPQILYPKWVMATLWAFLIFGFLSAAWLVIYGMITGLRAAGFF